jgi:hypothetical protein
MKAQTVDPKNLMKKTVLVLKADVSLNTIARLKLLGFTVIVANKGE